MTESQKTLSIFCQDDRYEPWARTLSEQHHWPLVSSVSKDHNQPILECTDSGIFLAVQQGKALLRINADFVSGSVAHRRQFGGGKNQLIGKAVGIAKGFRPRVLDMTAGLGRDAFVMATLGADVLMVERSVVVHVLLKDALERAKKHAEDHDDETLTDILNRMALVEGESLEFVETSEDVFDVVYLDPMFPERKKSALVKKEMRIFHDVVGADEDSDRLLMPALDKAKYRVVVKRPRIAPVLNNESPSYTLEGKSSRFDIYAKKSFPVSGV